MRNARIPTRPHIQGRTQSLRLRHSAQNLTDAGGLVLIRKLWDRLGVGERIDARTEAMPGQFRSSLIVVANRHGRL